jgi:protein-S-isoprenylcysteine O-methyltransferase Ste14
MSLVLKTVVSLVAVAVCMGLLLFLPAGTLHYPLGWTYLAVYVVTSLLICVYLLRRDPELLKRRLSGGPTAEKRPAQKVVMLFASLGFISLLVIAGFDHRYHWSHVNIVVAALGNCLVALGMYLVLLVFRENTFSSATIELAENQKVISTGPYAIVRHPMYACSFVYLVGMPLALGSYWGLIGLGATLPVLIWRLLDEEKFLADNLAGYRDYQKKVQYRLVPYVW